LKSNIHLHVLPSHTSNKTQPLDVGVFGPLQKKWIDCMEQIVEETGEGLPKHEFVNEYMAVREQAVTPEIIKAAFRKTGIWPINPDVFAADEFSPSHATSTQAHMPPSFPPPSPDLISTAPTSLSPSEISHSMDLDFVAPSSDSSMSSIPISVLSPEPDAMQIDPQLLDESHITWWNDPDDAEPIARSSQDVCPTESQARQPPTPASPTLPSSQSYKSHLTGPKAPQFSRTLVHKQWSTARRHKVLQADLQRLEALYLAEFQKRQELEVHCELSRQENEKLKVQLNRRVEKADGRKGKQMQAGGGVFLMSEDALKLFEQRKREKAEKEEAEQLKQVEKEREETALADRRTQLAVNLDVWFSGRLTSKKKQDLQDIAFVLALSTSGTKSELIATIVNHLSRSAYLQSDARFSKLFIPQNLRDSDTCDSQQQAAIEEENLPPSRPIASTSSHTLDDNEHDPPLALGAHPLLHSASRLPLASAINTPYHERPHLESFQAQHDPFHYPPYYHPPAQLPGL
jgi:hypothetical protein